MILNRRTVLAAALSAAACAPAFAQDAWFPLLGQDGREVPNFRIPVEIETEIGELDHVFAIGPEDADVTLVEVYDSNCGYCRRAAADLKAIGEADPDLRIKFVNAPSLGLASIQAARVEYAVKKVEGEEKLVAFHQAFMAERGFLDGPRALLIAADLGLNADEIERVADEPATFAVLREATRLANNANLAATPSFIIAGAAIIGYPGRRVLEAAVGAVRECDKIVCG